MQKKYSNGEYKRIEIDLVLKEVGNERFWDFIINKLKRLFTTRDYTRAINIPSYITPKPLGQLNKLVLDIVERIVKPHVDRYRRNLSEHKKGFLNVNQYEQEIEEQLQGYLIEHEEIIPILKEISSLVVKYS